MQLKRLILCIGAYSEEVAKNPSSRDYLGTPNESYIQGTFRKCILDPKCNWKPCRKRNIFPA